MKGDIWHFSTLGGITEGIVQKGAENDKNLSFSI